MDLYLHLRAGEDEPVFERGELFLLAGERLLDERDIELAHYDSNSHLWRLPEGQEISELWLEPASGEWIHFAVFAGRRKGLELCRPGQFTLTSSGGGAVLERCPSGRFFSGVAETLAVLEAGAWRALGDSVPASKRQGYLRLKGGAAIGDYEPEWDGGIGSLSRPSALADKDEL